MASNNEDIRGVFAPGARITVFGAGRMGLPISSNLKAAGYDVVVTDIRSEVAEAVMAQGVATARCFRRLAPTPPGLTSPPVLRWL